jgi:hypothetical protein
MFTTVDSILADFRKKVECLNALAEKYSSKRAIIAEKVQALEVEREALGTEAIRARAVADKISSLIA